MTRKRKRRRREVGGKGEAEERERGRDRDRKEDLRLRAGTRDASGTIKPSQALPGPATLHNRATREWAKGKRDLRPRNLGTWKPPLVAKRIEAEERREERRAERGWERASEGAREGGR